MLLDMVRISLVALYIEGKERSCLEVPWAFPGSKQKSESQDTWNWDGTIKEVSRTCMFVYCQVILSILIWNELTILNLLECE